MFFKNRHIQACFLMCVYLHACVCFFKTERTCMQPLNPFSTEPLFFIRPPTYRLFSFSPGSSFPISTVLYSSRQNTQKNKQKKQNSNKYHTYSQVQIFMSEQCRLTFSRKVILFQIFHLCFYWWDLVYWVIGNEIRWTLMHTWNIP